MICENLEQVKQAGHGVLAIEDDKVKVLDEGKLREELIDTLIFTAVFSPQAETAALARRVIRQAAADLGIFSASIQPLYEAMGRGEVSGFTVPAINIRGLTYCVAQAVLRAAQRGNVGAVLFEIARSEIGYTFQRPAEYATAVLAAAIKTGHRGPLFLQGDHFQIIAKRFHQDGAQEIKAVKDREKLTPWG